MGAAKYSVSFDRRVLASLLSPRIALINNLSSSKRGIALITLKKKSKKIRLFMGGKYHTTSNL